MPPADQIATAFRGKVWLSELFPFISSPLQSEMTFVLFFVFSLVLLRTMGSKSHKENAFIPHRTNSKAAASAI